MQTYISKKTLESQISELRENIDNDNSFFSKVIVLCKKVLVTQRKEILLKGFPSKRAEIYYFKEVKQIPLINLIYYTELRIFEVKFPFGSKKRQKRYISKSLDKINSFFNYNLSFVQYVESNSKYLDEQYFLRSNLDFSGVTQIKPYNVDSEFNTTHDILLAKVFAFKKLVAHLSNRLNKLLRPGFQEIPKSQLKWTSSKAALTELTYALYHGGAVNNGNTDIKDIAIALEQVFNFPLGDVYRTYSEIRSRKKEKSKFLNELSSSLISGMNSLDE